MIKTVLLLAGVLAFTTLPAMAAGRAIANPITPEQQASFLATCLKVAPEAEVLCKCKSEAAAKLVDTSFMDIIIASMKGKPLAAEYYDAYNDYIARSNTVCKPDYM